MQRIVTIAAAPLAQCGSACFSHADFTIRDHRGDDMEIEAPMEDLLDRLVAHVGVDRTTAEKSVGIILQFLMKEGPAGQVQALFDTMPGAQAILASAPPESGFGSMFGGVMAAGTRMMALGLSMDQVQAVARETLAYAREKAGADTVDAVVGAIPGLGQFI
jgi:hypothetical protein